MIVYACMCEQTLDCEYVIILMLCYAANAFFLLYLMNLYLFILHEIFESWPSNSWAFCYTVTHSVLNHNLKSNINHLWSHDEHAKKQSALHCTVRGFKVWRKLPKAPLLKSQALVTITANSLPSPLNGLSEKRELLPNVRVKHCVKSKISLIILSKWNVCLCSFSVILLTVRADCEAKL